MNTTPITATNLLAGQVVVSDLGFTTEVAITAIRHTGEVTVWWKGGGREDIAPDDVLNVMA